MNRRYSTKTRFKMEYRIQSVSVNSNNNVVALVQMMLHVTSSLFTVNGTVFCINVHGKNCQLRCCRCDLITINYQILVLLSESGNNMVNKETLNCFA